MREFWNCLLFLRYRVKLNEWHGRDRVHHHYHGRRRRRRHHHHHHHGYCYCYCYFRALVCVANVLRAIRGMGKFVVSLVSVQLTMEAATLWHAAWITLVSTTKFPKQNTFTKCHVRCTFWRHFKPCACRKPCLILKYLLHGSWKLYLSFMKWPRFPDSNSTPWHINILG